MNDPTSDTQAEIICKGIVGVGSPLLAVITANQEQVEWWLKILSLLAGIIVAILTGWSIWKKRAQK